MTKVFMYGPDTRQGRMFDRIGPSEFVGPGSLEGYELVFDKPNMKNKAEGFHNIRESVGKKVFGIVFDLTPKQQETLSGYFGGYGRKSLEIKVIVEGTEESHLGSVWLARRTKKSLKPTQSSIEATKKGMEENGADSAFIQALESFEVLE